MRLLYVCGTYCPSFGGAEISAHTFLNEAEKRGVSTLAITDKKYSNNYRGYGSYDSVRLFGTSYEERINDIEMQIETFFPDVILTQLLWSDVALRIAKARSIPSILRICKVPFSLDIREESLYSPTELIAVSESVGRYVQEQWGRKCVIIHPPIKINSVISNVDDHYFCDNITMFNPLERKGGKIFRQICEMMPERKFAVIYGWNTLKENVDSFDNNLLRQMCESLGTSYSGKPPAIAHFSDLSNVNILEPTIDVTKIFAQTRILCVPSIWEEAFGRVAVEGFANGIPVLGSDVGGLKEIVSQAGILMTDYHSALKWEEKIISLDDHDEYLKYALKGREFATKKYSLDKIVEQFENLLIDLTGKIDAR